MFGKTPTTYQQNRQDTSNRQSMNRISTYVSLIYAMNQSPNQFPLLVNETSELSTNCPLFYELNCNYFITVLLYVKDTDSIYSIYLNYYHKRTQLEPSGCLQLQ